MLQHVCFCLAFRYQTVQFKLIARKAKETKWKTKRLWRPQCSNNADTSVEILPKYWRNDRIKMTPDIEENQQVKAKDHRRERSSFTWAIHTPEQPKQQRRKEACTDLNRTFAQSGTDNELKEEEFIEALRRSGKNTAPAPDRIRYTDTKNIQKRTGVRCTPSTKKASAKAVFPKTGQTASWDIFPTGKDHHKMNGYHIFTMQNTVAELLKRVVARKMRLLLHMTCTKDSRGKNKQRLWKSILRMLTTESISSCWWNYSCNMESA